MIRHSPAQPTEFELDSWYKRITSRLPSARAFYFAKYRGSAGAGFARVIVIAAMALVAASAARADSSVPSIVTQPVSQSVNIGQTATFTVVASGPAPLSYQWQKNNIPIPGANSASYTTPVTTLSDNGATFRVGVSNSVGGVASSTVTLSVLYSPPSIVTQPASQAVPLGQTATFTVVGAGTGPLIYRWRKNNISIAGATFASYTTPPITQADDGTKYVVSVSDNFSGVTSVTVTVNVANAAITTQPVNETVAIGQPATFTVAATGSALIYQWRKNNISITGANSPSYTTPLVTQADDGTKYVVSVSNSLGGATSNFVTLTVANPSIVTQPVNRLLSLGQVATFGVVAKGTPPLAYQWSRNNVPIPGATAASYTTPALTQADNKAKYTVSVSNAYGSAVSDAAVLSIGNPSITTQPVGQTLALGQTATFTVAGTGAPPLVYQWRKNNISISGATSASYTTPPVTQADDGTTYVVSLSNSYGGVTSNTVVINMGNPTITTQPINQTVAIGQAATFAVAGKGAALIYQWRKNNISITGANSPSYTTAPVTQADDGTKYVVSVSNSYGGATSNTVILNVANPSIATQPVSQLLALGQAATFSVVAKGAPPLAYKWSRNNVPISGATAASYTTPALTQADNGAKYTVSVTNAYGSVGSNAALVSLGNPSITTQPVSQMLSLGQTATFTVAGTGAPPIVYQWRKNNISIAGATSPSYTTPPVTQTDDGSTYVASLSNSYGGVTSSAVVLRIGNPSITTQPVNRTVAIGQSATFAVLAKGPMPLIYAWRKNNISIAGATAATYTTPPVTQADDGASYVVSVSNSYGGVTSNFVTLRVVGDPAIVTQPLSQSFVPGVPVTFNVTTSGTDPISYAWFRNGTAIAGATSASYSFTPTTADIGSSFVVVISNSKASVTSQPATLSLAIPVTIDTAPQNQTVALGQTAGFSVVAESSFPLNYQWQRLARGQSLAQDIPGATSPSYVTPPVTAADQGSQYTVRVADRQGNSVLVSATLTVTPTSPAVYFVDYAAGDDNNDGTSQALSWRHAPGMTGCAGFCSMTVLYPGDRVLFKGGVIWDRQAFPMNITSSGSQSAPIYFGADQSWFVGAAWAKPVFDLSGAVLANSPVAAASVNFVTIDNVEIRNTQLNIGNQWPARGSITVYGGTNFVLQNCYIRGWSDASSTPGPVVAGIAFVDGATGGTVSNCMFDGGPANDTVTGIYGGSLIQGNTIQNVTNGIEVFSDQENVNISGNRIFNVGLGQVSTRTQNAVEVWGAAAIYNNVIHDLYATATAVSLQSFSTSPTFNQYVYNNLIWNIGTTSAVKTALPGGIAQKQFIYNNTIQAGAAGCVQAVPGNLVGGNLTVENNHCISDQTNWPAWCWNSAQNNSSCGSVSSITFSGNVLMTASDALAQGYTIDDSFQPSTPSSGTIAAGLDLSAQCSGLALQLCQDRLAALRPSGSAWDAGAYVYAGASAGRAPMVTADPASSVTLVGQRATFTVVATGAPAPTFQWLENGIAIPGATASGYTTAPATLADDGSEFAVIVTNASGSIQSGVAILSVRNTPGSLSSSTSSVDFGNVYVGLTAPAQVTLTNTGQLNVSILNVSVTGAGIQASGVQTGAILVPGQAVTLLLTFSPSSIGTVSGSVTVTSDGANSPLTIALAGNGVELPGHGVILSWTPSTSDVVGYRVYRRIDPAGPWVSLSTTLQITNNFADVNVSAGQAYDYAVKSVDENNVDSDFPDSVQATIPTP